jgi:hypothetical protein
LVQEVLDRITHAGVIVEKSDQAVAVWDVREKVQAIDNFWKNGASNFGWHFNSVGVESTAAVGVEVDGDRIGDGAHGAQSEDSRSECFHDNDIPSDGRNQWCERLATLCTVVV